MVAGAWSAAADNNTATTDPGDVMSHAQDFAKQQLQHTDNTRMDDGDGENSGVNGARAVTQVQRLNGAQTHESYPSPNVKEEFDERMSADSAAKLNGSVQYHAATLGGTALTNNYGEYVYNKLSNGDDAMLGELDSDMTRMSTTFEGAVNPAEFNAAAFYGTVLQPEVPRRARAQSTRKRSSSDAMTPQYAGGDNMEFDEDYHPGSNRLNSMGITQDNAATQRRRSQRKRTVKSMPEIDLPSETDPNYIDYEYADMGNGQTNVDQGVTSRGRSFSLPSVASAPSELPVATNPVPASNAAMPHQPLSSNRSNNKLGLHAHGNGKDGEEGVAHMSPCLRMQASWQ